MLKFKRPSIQKTYVITYKKIAKILLCFDVKKRKSYVFLCDRLGFFLVTQMTITCSKLTIETLKLAVKYVQSQQERTTKVSGIIFEAVGGSHLI